MQSRDFCFWLQGFFELNGEAAALSADQAAMIRRHLDMVFHHEIAPRSSGLDLRDQPAAPRPAAPAPVPSPAPAPAPEPPATPEYDPEQPPTVRPPPPLC